MATRLTLIRKNQHGIYVDWPEFFSPLAPDSFYLDPILRDVNADGRTCCCNSAAAIRGMKIPAR
ncbi:MAG: hypothetical protein Q9P90_11065 [candidate division KSB1 bacterium]|nr:hypothetical protein [candidate division KSB1 bacterium]